MVSTSHANQDIKYILLVALRRVCPSILVGLSLIVTTWVYGVEFKDAYTALLIVAVLLALMLFPGSGRSVNAASSGISALSISVITRWCLLVAVLLLLGYATKTSSIFSRRVLLSWFVLTPPLLAVTQIIIEILISRMLQSAGNTRRVVIAGASEIGHTLAAKMKSSTYLGMQFEAFSTTAARSACPATRRCPCWASSRTSRSTCARGTRM